MEQIKTHALPSIHGAVALYDMETRALLHEGHNMVVFQGFRQMLYALTGFKSDTPNNLPLLNRFALSYGTTSYNMTTEYSGLPSLVTSSAITWDSTNVSIFKGRATFNPGAFVNGTIGNSWLISNQSIGPRLFSAMEIGPFAVTPSTGLILHWWLSRFPFPHGIFDLTFNQTFN